MKQFISRLKSLKNYQSSKNYVAYFKTIFITIISYSIIVLYNYFQFCHIYLFNKEVKSNVKTIEVDDLSIQQREFFAYLVSLTAGTVAFVDDTNIIIHSVCDYEEELQKIYEISKYI